MTCQVNIAANGRLMDDVFARHEHARPTPGGEPHRLSSRAAALLHPSGQR